MTTPRKPPQPKRPLVRIEVAKEAYEDGLMSRYWMAFVEGVEFCSHSTKGRVLERAKDLAKALARRGCTVEVKPRDESGRYVKSERATYPRSADPRRRKG